jgi:hypothetical protein
MCHSVAYFLRESTLAPSFLKKVFLLVFIYTDLQAMAVAVGAVVGLGFRVVVVGEGFRVVGVLEASEKLQVSKVILKVKLLKLNSRRHAFTQLP